jgi:hypothetical protein
MKRVGWAKARLRRAHHLSSGRNPDWWARFALPTLRTRNDEIVGITFQWLLRTDFRQIEARAVDMIALIADFGVKTRCA